MIAVLSLFSFSLFCLNDMGKGGSYDGYTSIFGSVDFTTIFIVDFISSTTEGYIGVEIQFTDTSIGTPTSWEWDVENDGIYDYFIQHPAHTYNIVGTYSVKLKISNSTMVDSLVQENLITVEYVPPAEPQNVQVDIVYPDAIISWTAVDTTIFGDPITPDGYIILYNETAYEDEQFYYYLDYITDLTYTHTFVAQHREQMFYEVVAYLEYSREQVGYLSTLRNLQEKVLWKDVKRNLNEIRE